jgi:hypothetical protein
MFKEFPDSKNVASASYDAQAKQLQVTFRNQSSYMYTGVPLEVVEQFYSAPSAGSFLASQIKSKFSFAKVKNAVKEG